MARGVLKSMATVSGLILLSRIFGFARQVLISGVIGASGSPVADAFWAAFRLPNMFRRLFAEGAFQAAFIPLFQGRLVEGGEQEAKQFAEDVMAWLVFILTGLSALVMIFAPIFVTLLAGGFRDDPEKFNLATDYTRIMFPYLACMSLVGLCGGMLNALHKFVAAAAAPIALNIVLIIAVLLNAKGEVVITGYAAAWGVFAAGIIQLSILMFGAWRSGFLLRLRLPKMSPHVKRMLMLGWPGFIGAGALQFNTIIGTNIASRQSGAISWLMNADQLYQLPLAMIGIALGIVLMPSISRAVKEGDEKRARDNLNRGLEIALLFAVPAAAALVAMPVLICAALYTDFAGDALQLVGFEKSAFTLHDAEMTGMALMLFGCGLPSFVFHKVIAAAFFARENTRTPMKFALLSITISTSLALILFQHIGYLAIPLATAIASYTEVSLLTRQLWKRGIFRPDQRLRRRVPRIILSALLMGFLVWAIAGQKQILLPLFGGQLWAFLIGIALIGASFYAAAVLTLKGASLNDLKGALGQR
ncbi:MAG: murein biosynthesis integral membrane protein MurJ [bacterium]